MVTEEDRRELEIIDKIKEMEYSLSQMSFTDTAKYYANLLGEPYENIFAQLLMLMSRTLGPYIDYPSFPSIKARANLYILLVAPAGIFHRSTLINKTKEMTESVHTSVKSEIGVVISDKYKQQHLTFDGSPEGLADDILKKNITHFNHDEFSEVIEADSTKGKYKQGILELLNNAYYGQGGTRSLRNGKSGEKRSVVVPDGKYITLFAGLHEDELNSKLYKLGTVRRSLIVHLSYDDLIPNANALDKENVEEVEVFEGALMNFLKVASINLLIKHLEFTLKPTGKNDEYGNPEFKSDLDFKKPVIKYDDEAVKFLESETIESEERVKEEQRQFTPQENIELMMRIAINIMLFEYAKNPMESPLIVKLKHIQEAKAYLTKITSNYIDEISKIDNSNLQNDVNRLVAVLKKKCEKGEKENASYIAESTVRQALNWDFGRFDKAVVEASRQDKLRRIFIQYTKRPGHILTPMENFDKTIKKLDGMVSRKEVLYYKVTEKRVS